MPFVKPRHKALTQTADNRQPFFPSNLQLVQRSRTGISELTNSVPSTFFRPRTTTGTAGPIAFPAPMPNAQVQTSQGGQQPLLARIGSQYVHCSISEKKAIDTAVKEARRLVQRALNQLTHNGAPNKFAVHFGSAPRKLVIARYQAILGSLGNKRFVCSSCDPIERGNLLEEEIPEAQLNDPNHLCGLAPVPGNTIILCPAFFYSARNAGKKNKNNNSGTNSSLPCHPAATIIHEAAHNDGAGGDIPPGSNAYPPQNAEDNAYSYEMFAVLP
jgi:hypothetical protein